MKDIYVLEYSAPKPDFDGWHPIRAYHAELAADAALVTEKQFDPSYRYRVTAVPLGD